MISKKYEGSISHMKLDTSVKISKASLDWLTVSLLKVYM